MGPPMKKTDAEILAHGQTMAARLHRNVQEYAAGYPSAIAPEYFVRQPAPMSAKELADEEFQHQLATCLGLFIGTHEDPEQAKDQIKIYDLQASNARKNTKNAYTSLNGHKPAGIQRLAHTLMRYHGYPMGIFPGYDSKASQ